MNTKAQKIQSKAKAAISKLSLRMLCDSFELTNQKEITIELAHVRGWLTDELERRDHNKFDAWLMTDDVNLMDFPSKFYL